MEDKLLVRREGAGVFNGSYKLFSAVFSTDYSYVKVFALGRSVSLFFVIRMRNWRLNAGLKLPSTLSPIPVFVPPLLSHTCAF